MNTSFAYIPQADDEVATKGFVRFELYRFGEKLEKRLETKLEQKLNSKIGELRRELPGIVVRSLRMVLKEESDKLKEDNSKWKSDILSSNDQVSNEYKNFETEKASLNNNYKQLLARTDKLEDFAKRTSNKIGLEFNDK